MDQREEIHGEPAPGCLGARPGTLRADDGRRAPRGAHEQDGAQAAALTYGITLTGTAVMFNAIWFYASLGRRLLREDADPRVVSGITRSYLPGPWIYLAATLIALASPVASVILFGAIAVFYVAESSLFGRSNGIPG